jgi:predicted metal-dependent phosphoesterase TrpH
MRRRGRRSAVLWHARQLDAGIHRHGSEEAMSWLKTVIHVHTNYSFDANSSPEGLVTTACRQGVDCLAVTDHNTIEGALAARRVGGVQVVVGEEISSADGHVIGLFLQERVPRGLSVEETAARIRSQGGVVLAPHPFSRLCSDSLQAETARLLPWLDAVEICNSQDLIPRDAAKARRFACEHGLPVYVGADTHVRGHQAACYQLLPAFEDADGFRAALRQAVLHPGRFGPSYFALMGWRHLWGKLTGTRWPGFGANARGLSQTPREEGGAGPGAPVDQRPGY